MAIIQVILQEQELIQEVLQEQENGNCLIENTYSKGSITGQAAGAIVGFKESGTIRNSYYLENTISGYENRYEGAKTVSDNVLKDIYTSLGDAFKQDIDNVNDGYPILSWQ